MKSFSILILWYLTPFSFPAVSYSEGDMFASQSQEDTEVSGELSETFTNYGDFVKGSADGRYDLMENDGKGSLLFGIHFLRKDFMFNSSRIYTYTLMFISEQKMLIFVPRLSLPLISFK